MYYVVFEDEQTKVRWFVAFCDKTQFDEDYSPEFGTVIAPGVSKKKAEELCQINN